MPLRYTPRKRAVHVPRVASEGIGPIHDPHMKRTSPPGELLAMVPRVRALRTTVGHAKRAAKKAWSPGLSPGCALASSPRSPSAKPRPRSRSPGNRTLRTPIWSRHRAPARRDLKSPRRPGLTQSLRPVVCQRATWLSLVLEACRRSGALGRGRTCNLSVRSRTLNPSSCESKECRVGESDPCYRLERAVS